MEQRRRELAHLVGWARLELAANDVLQGERQFAHISNLAAYLLALEMAGDIPEAVRQLRELRLHEADNANMCRLFCSISRVHEETERYLEGLQSPQQTTERTMPEIQSINMQMRTYRENLREHGQQARELNVPAHRGQHNPFKLEIQVVHTQLERFRDIFTTLAATFELLSMTFCEQLYHPALASLEDGELLTVKGALDSINMRMESLYDTAQNDKACTQQKIDVCDHLFKKAADERAARQQQKSAASSTTAQTAETTHKTLPNPAGHEAQRVEALRNELEETLPAPKTGDRRRPQALKPATRDASRIPTPDLATRAQQDDEEFPAATQASSTQYGAPSNYSGTLSAPLPPANAMMSFSAVEEQVHRRGQHNRAATIEPSNYIAEEGIAGPPQLGSVVRTRRSGQSRPRIFTGSFNALENGMQQLRLVGNYGSTTREMTERTGRPGPIVVRDFATPSGSGTPVTSIPPSPVTLSHRHDARLGREHENQDRVVDRRPRPEPRQVDRTRTETLGNTGTGFTDWLEQPGRNNNDRPRSSSSRRRRERTL
ncbi:hypothetical protein CKM354_000431600 [Cercospora kikuchii]|uniref:Uncharacterized protein n=1 Tax=Cercospora kikuchii TaxID=84275 RepID=A0A9P3FBD8_9PEZI|nr:uncharacterized protein CKM354_000431600 [Cercospora kikuchii]GIZ40998.1 hypothetical protein CKM354_000431600 [Cercospora kikuchii]